MGDSDDDDCVLIGEVQSGSSRKKRKFKMKPKLEDNPVITASDDFSMEAFQCPICIDLLYEPCVVPCGHEFCRSCLASVIHSANIYRFSKAGTECPVCRSIFQATTLGFNRHLHAVITRLFPVESSRRAQEVAEDEEKLSATNARIVTSPLLMQATSSIGLAQNFRERLPLSAPSAFEIGWRNSLQNESARGIVGEHERWRNLTTSSRRAPVASQLPPLQDAHFGAQVVLAGSSRTESQELRQTIDAANYLFHLDRYHEGVQTFNASTHLYTPRVRRPVTSSTLPTSSTSGHHHMVRHIGRAEAETTRLSMFRPTLSSVPTPAEPQNVVSRYTCEQSNTFQHPGIGMRSLLRIPSESRPESRTPTSNQATPCGVPPPLQPPSMMVSAAECPLSVTGSPRLPDSSTGLLSVVAPSIFNQALQNPEGAATSVGAEERATPEGAVTSVGAEERATPAEMLLAWDDSSEEERPFTSFMELRHQHEEEGMGTSLTASTRSENGPGNEPLSLSSGTPSGFIQLEVGPSHAPPSVPPVSASGEGEESQTWQAWQDVARAFLADPSLSTDFPSSSNLAEVTEVITEAIANDVQAEIQSDDMNISLIDTSWVFRF
ncbi:hypothetical protein CEUSTIGMA_g4190.t1 [Chlamydomonas eustigma]|uniref:RING-type domain-containing protein n=1 Tax=Chlamydomonas eustigma TaxID=1157962 RepID=A0A250X0Z1_9CHLO|nr:hypothetical protein CEUSTIGMA_g4190.t1 [Chlamydomonas eustigma]|eukprot:GAX76743.1 hypothetical protein CEUSTIGMA_g4190.t1 [Chlamydomonas eustigma]